MLILAACGEKKSVEEESSADKLKEEATQTKEETTYEMARERLNILVKAMKCRKRLKESL